MLLCLFLPDTHDCVMPGYLSRLLSLAQTMCQYADVVIEICQANINTCMDDCCLFVCYSLHRIRSHTIMISIDNIYCLVPHMLLGFMLVCFVILM